MNITCNIIKDLLPLYVEDMVSEDSKALVDDHLCSCDSCTKELAELKKAPKVPVEVETTSLKRVEDTIRKRKMLTAATAGRRAGHRNHFFDDTGVPDGPAGH